MRDGESFGWAVVGPGRIAHRFAEAVQRTDGAGLVAVRGRDASRAGEFARKWTLDRPAVSVAVDTNSLFDNPDVDAVYVATPHAFHADAIRQCIAAGMPVLCEKPLVPDLATGIELIGAARDARVFLMEAVWTRFLPVYAVIREWLRDGAVGHVRGIQSSFCFNLPYDAAHRAYDPAQAGGALLDIGIYNLAMTRWVLQVVDGACPPLESLHARAVIGPSGVDHRLHATLDFAGGVCSQFLCGFEMSGDNTLRIIGEHGTIVVPRFWQATEAHLLVAGRDALAVARPFRVNGFEYEIEEAMRVIRAGGIESASIPHDETLETLRWMSRIREQVGVRYPFEAAPA
jgi:predicted dehydrogenase